MPTANVWYVRRGLALGDRVQHPSRGEGTIVVLDPESERVHIKFDIAKHGMHRYRESSWLKKFAAQSPNTVRRKSLVAWEEDSKRMLLFEACKAGKDAAGTERLTRSASCFLCPATELGEEGLTPLMLCIRHGDRMVPAARAMLMDASPAALRTACRAPSKYAGADALWFACRANAAVKGGELIASLLERSPSITSRDAVNGTTALWQACANGLAEPAAILAERGADVNVIERETGRSCLYAATAAGSVAIVRMLVARGAEINASDVHGTNALWRACYAKLGPLALFLIEQGADVRSTSLLKGWDCLLCACSAGLIAVANVLLKKGVDVKKGVDLRDGTNGASNAKARGAHTETNTHTHTHTLPLRTFGFLCQ